MTPLTLSPARVQQLYEQFLDDAKDFILANQEMETSALLEGAKKYALGRAVERCAEAAVSVEISIPMVMSVATSYHEAQLEKLKHCIAKLIRGEE